MVHIGLKRGFLVLLLSMIIIASCENGQDVVNGKIEFAEGTEFTANFKATGGSATYNFTSTVDWVAKADDAWVKVTPSSGTSGKGSIEIEVDENEESEPRSSRVELSIVGNITYTIYIEQNGASDVFDVNKRGVQEVPSKGGSVKIVVTTNLEYKVVIPEEATSWLSVADTRAVRSETLTFTAAANEELEKRMAEVVLEGNDGEMLQKIVFAQAGADRSFKSDAKDVYRVSYKGSVVEIRLTTNLEYSVEIPAEATSWLSVADTRAVRKETLTFTIAANDSVKEREAKVQIVGRDGEILQNIGFMQTCIKPSANVLTMELTEVTESEAVVMVTASVVKDAYVCNIATADDWKGYGRANYERVNYIKNNINLEEVYGSKEFSFTSLKPGVEYVVYAFGIYEGVVTTQPWIVIFTTNSSEATAEQI